MCVCVCVRVCRYALVIRSLLTQEGICMTLKPDFHFLEVRFAHTHTHTHTHVHAYILHIHTHVQHVSRNTTSMLKVHVQEQGKEIAQKTLCVHSSTCRCVRTCVWRYATAPPCTAALHAHM